MPSSHGDAYGEKTGSVSDRPVINLHGKVGFRVTLKFDQAYAGHGGCQSVDRRSGMSAELIHECLNLVI
jgi:hypothetical protein